jgi:AbrB family looped-hinge helix DNA binding protein
MPDTVTQAEIQLGSQGRLVIPASLRRALGFNAGDRLVARLEEGRLILEKAETIKRRLKARFAKVSRDISLADELITERRDEARREASE